jgi:hypothetical protein
MTNGFCPACAINGEQVIMRINQDDFWECPKCHLQISTKNLLFATVLPWRGKSEFRTTNSNSFPDGWCITKPKKGSIDADETIIMTKAQFTEYVKNEVEKNSPVITSLPYYADLAYKFLHETKNPYLDGKRAISMLFNSGFKLKDYSSSNASLIINARLTLIDSYYSTNIGKMRYFGISDIVETIMRISDSDDNLVALAKELTMDHDVQKLEELLEGSYGLSKNNEDKGKATSLLSKYLYFLSEYKFPIYDSIVKKHYKSIAKKFKVNLNNANGIGNIKFFYEMNILNYKVNDFNKLDNLIWLFGKIKKGSYSLIISKEIYLKLVERIREKHGEDINDEIVQNYIALDLNKLEEWKVFNKDQIEFIRFVASV